MVMEDLVKKVNTNLTRLHDQATRSRENPVLIELLDNLVQLTTIQAPTPAPKGEAPINTIE